MSRLRILTLLALVGAAACKSDGGDRPPLKIDGADAAAPKSHNPTPAIERWFRETVPAAGVCLMPGDRISIVVQDHPELNLSPEVPPNGEIRVYRENKSVDRVKALGKTTQELEAAITAVHAADLEHPFVTVRIDVAAPRSIYVIGAVKAPNVYTVSGNDRLTVLQALALAGGQTEKADLSSVVVHRVYPPTGETASSPPLDIAAVIGARDQKDNLIVAPGDTIVVPESQDATVQVLGRVEKPGQVPWRRGMRLSEAIAGAGSFQKFAKTSKIKIVRHGAETIVVDYDEVLDGKTPDPELEPRDVIFVDERWM